MIDVNNFMNSLLTYADVVNSLKINDAHIATLQVGIRLLQSNLLMRKDRFLINHYIWKRSVSESNHEVVMQLSHNLDAALLKLPVTSNDWSGSHVCVVLLPCMAHPETIRAPNDGSSKKYIITGHPIHARTFWLKAPLPSTFLFCEIRQKWHHCIFYVVPDPCSLSIMLSVNEN